MVTTIKVTMLAFNYRDGKIQGEPQFPVNGLAPLWKEMALVKLPSPLEFFGYISFFPTFLAGPRPALTPIYSTQSTQLNQINSINVALGSFQLLRALSNSSTSPGPAFHFKTYRDFFDDKLFVSPQFNPTGARPSSLFPTLIVLGQAILSLIVHVVLGAQFPVKTLYLENAFSDSNFLWPLVYAYFAIAGLRCQYYFAWKLSEGAGILTGLGYEFPFVTLFDLSRPELT